MGGMTGCSAGQTAAGVPPGDSQNTSFSDNCAMRGSLV
jgi:hypothetical protein